MADSTTPQAAPPRRSPLAHLAERLNSAADDTKPVISLCERPFVTMIALRAEPQSGVAERFARVLGCRLPDRSGHTVTAADRTVIWMRPDEWLVTSRDEPQAMTQRLTTALGSRHGSVVDVSANRTTLELTGSAARETLEKGCALDLHPRAFGPDTAVPTQVARIPVILWQIDDTPTYRLLPRASFADYLARWLLDAMSEYTADDRCCVRRPSA